MANYMEISLRQLSKNSKTLLHMYKRYLLINENLINAKQTLRYWLFFHSITTSSFPDELKLAVISAFKKDDPLDKGNYRPTSLLSHTSKIYEKNTFQPNQ